MGTTNLIAVNAQTISVDGTLIDGSSAHAAPVTHFDTLDASAVVALNGVPVTGTLPAGAVYTNFTALDATAITVNGVPISGGGGGESWPFNFALTGDTVGWGSSTMAGQDLQGPMERVSHWATGDTFYDRDAAVPGSGGIIIKNAGVGGETATQITARIVAAAARLKAADAILHYGGNWSGVPIDPVGETMTKIAEAVGATGLNHTNCLFTAKHHDRNGEAGYLDWVRQRDLTTRLRAVYPGKVTEPSIYIREQTPADLTDEANREADQQFTSKSADLSHLNDEGDNELGEGVYAPWVAYRSGVLPFIGHQRVYSTAATNQTNGGVVATLDHLGDLTGCTVSVVDNANFTADINAGTVRLLRATGTLLLDAPYRFRVRISKDGQQRDSWMVVYLMDLTGTRRGRIRLRSGHLCATNHGLMTGLRGRTGSTGLSFALGIKSNAGNGVAKRVLQFGGASSPRGLVIEIKSSNVVGFNTYNTSGTLIESVDSSTSAAQQITVANGLMWVFGHHDFVAGTSQMVVNENTATTGTMTAGQTYAVAEQHTNAIMHYLWGNGPSSNTHSDSEIEALAVWEGSPINWTVGANRDLVRDLATRETLLHTTRGGDGPGVVNGLAPLVWFQGCAANFASGMNLADGNRILEGTDPYSVPWTTV
jgi:hypothetical protein